jgi:hypothetical protein
MHQKKLLICLFFFSCKWLFAFTFKMVYQSDLKIQHFIGNFWFHIIIRYVNFDWKSLFFVYLRVIKDFMIQGGDFVAVIDFYNKMKLDFNIYGLFELYFRTMVPASCQFTVVRLLTKILLLNIMGPVFYQWYLKFRSNMILSIWF